MISRGRRRHIVKIVKDAEFNRVWNSMSEDEKDAMARQVVGQIQDAIANALRIPVRMIRFSTEIK